MGKKINDWMSAWDKANGWDTGSGNFKPSNLTTPSGGYSGSVKKYGVGSSKGDYKSCHETHPPLEIVPGVVITGGSCSFPAVKDADIYIGFDSGMKLTGKHLPFYEGSDREVYFPLRDRSAPEGATVEHYKKLVAWTADQLLQGRKVHCGCIGGHGRTGMFLSALVEHMTGNKDATAFVREKYCKKAVESHAQVEFLHKEFGINKVEPRDHGGHKSSGSQKALPFSPPPAGVKTTGNPVEGLGCIWG
jgi:hypothetical protein